MTYDLESTLPMITVHPHWDAPAYFEAEEVPFERKHDAAVMFTSNCKNAGAQKRLAYYEELMSHMDVRAACARARADISPRGRARRNPSKDAALSHRSTRTESACTTRTSRPRRKG